MSEERFHKGGIWKPVPSLEPEVRLVRNRKIIDALGEGPGAVTITVDTSKRPPDTAAVMRVRETLQSALRNRRTGLK